MICDDAQLWDGALTDLSCWEYDATSSLSSVIPLIDSNSGIIDSLTWSGYHSHRRADRWISSLYGHRTQTSPPSLKYDHWQLRWRWDLLLSVNLLNGSVQDDMGFLGLWSWRNFSDETEWVIIIPTIWSNEQSCHICIWNDEWYTGIKICVFFVYFLVISQSWRGALVGCWSGTGPAFALGWFMRQQ